MKLISPVTGKALQTTRKQSEARRLLGRHSRVLLYGGARSGKTWLIVLWELLRLAKYPGARVLMARWRAVHARQSLFRQTILPLLRDLWGGEDRGYYSVNQTDMVITLRNGSELWIGGLDDKDRTEKLLGQEYLDIYINEVSQVSYDTVVLVLTRLAQVIAGARNTAVFDCNPPSPLHWSHRMFIEHVEPKERKPLQRPERFGELLMNPDDNREHLPADFIDGLDDLPEAARKRMKYGEWVKPEGAIYEIPDSVIIRRQDVPPIEDFTVGVDFGLHGAAVLLGWTGDMVYALADCGGYNLTANVLGEMIGTMTARNWTTPPEQDEQGDFWPVRRRGETTIMRAAPAMDFVSYGDPAGGERLQQIPRCNKANNSVEPGIEAIQDLLRRGLLRIVDECTGLLGEIFDYKRDQDTGKIVKLNDHYCDALRYGYFSRAGVPQLRIRGV